ncbi:YwdI family protein [Bacillus marinisedimentorum]|uniref:YwdI family protein n=1 Tax=Bacillus marinisedimentorum TaxID=1821260 RepID=UPI0007E17D25|nr:YwdI family protein [Bacillus marinisedimentorum]
MNIPIDRLLDKIQQETEAARREAKAGGSSAKVKERMRTVKTLSELVLDGTEEGTGEQRMPAQIQQAYPPAEHSDQGGQPAVIQNNGQQPGQITKLNETKLDEDDANGDSLFDF